MFRAILIIGLASIGCSAPASSPSVEVPSTEASEPAIAASPQSEASARADALIDDMRRREAAFKQIESKLPQPNVAAVKESAPARQPSVKPVTPTVAAAVPDYGRIPEPPAPERQRPAVDILSSSYSITERNKVFWRFSWKMSLRNQERTPIAVRAGMEFLDSRGYILDTDNETQTIDGSTMTDISGFALISVDQASAVTQARAVARKIQ